ncbi:PD-(D/E)XK nuclease domain-containing protein, partial [uncultured Ruminobacter sp.]|uniref:PD-(D/E)XK nuclease domain-containing protein n=1 Tax=uncultured Ruminobacter sp. TaxID=538947 RepID=UPI0025DD69FF
KCFKSKILNFLKNNSVMKNNTGKLVKGLFEGDAETVENSLNGLLAKYVSIRDFSVNAPKENYYHGFMNGLLVNGTSYIEEHKSNTEAGDGYADLILLSSGKNAIAVLELKIASGELDDRISISEKAIEQIIKTKYADRFMTNKTIKSVYAFGICFYKKNCSVVCKKLK